MFKVNSLFKSIAPTILFKMPSLLFVVFFRRSWTFEKTAFVTFQKKYWTKKKLRLILFGQASGETVRSGSIYAPHGLNCTIWRTKPPIEFLVLYLQTHRASFHSFGFWFKLSSFKRHLNSLDEFIFEQKYKKWKKVALVNFLDAEIRFCLKNWRIFASIFMFDDNFCVNYFIIDNVNPFNNISGD